MIKLIAKYWARATANPASIPMNNKFATGPAPVPYQEDYSPKVKKSTWARLSGRQTMRESLMEEIIQVEQARISKMRNIAILQADVDHATSLRDRLAVLYQQTSHAERALTRLQYVLEESNEVSPTLAELRASSGVDQEMLEFLDHNDAIKRDLDPRHQTSTSTETLITATL